ncbi:MAG: tRNA (N6-isopentenyl adenosine(37)-C2)-methylthiotransferase MiaB [Spirochaetes bacterium]|nr:tRNA (N6-isopentenyl adenosine(37)-C2)-methylthiotransferase MiaB [Spirochaetota bacterium]
MMNVFIETYGCQMNKADSAVMMEALLEHGYQIVNHENDADIILLNTCSVRKTAENRIYGRIGYYKSLKEKKRAATGKKLILVIAGCMSQRLGEGLLKKHPPVDIVVGTYYRDQIPQVLYQFLNDNQQIFVEQKKFTFQPSQPDQDNPHKAFVTISHGCNNFCSYCIVPYLRGREISRSSAEIIADINDLVEKGVWQITLLGQNVNSYGQDNNEISFAQLLKKICQETDLQWIKFLSSHPKDFHEDLMNVMAEEKKVANCLHLAVQSGSNNILKKMNRHYHIEDYIRNVKKLQSMIPNLYLTTDIIVGFSGESAADYQATLDLINEVRFDDAFMYKYNVRESTLAANKYEDNVAEDIKQHRLAEVIKLQRKISLENKKERIGQTFEVISEYKSKKAENEILGLTKEDLAIVYQGNKEHFHQILNIKATKMKGNTLYGEII